MLTLIKSSGSLESTIVVHVRKFGNLSIPTVVERCCDVSQCAASQEHLTVHRISSTERQ